VRDDRSVAGPRRTQAERRATTRAALLDATVECLVEAGYSGTTTTEVTRRAGVSLGALLHHFPTKADLLAAAVAHVVQLRQAEFRKAMSNVDMGSDRLDAAIDQLWAAFSGPAFVAWVELWVGARTDPDLARAVRAVDDEFDRSSREIFQELFPADEYPDANFLEHGMRFALVLLDGLALRGLVVRPLDTTPVELLKDVARLALDRPDHARGAST
jgi:AcrR family transcriptional regulator